MKKNKEKNKFWNNDYCNGSSGWEIKLRWKKRNGRNN